MTKPMTLQEAVEVLKWVGRGLVRSKELTAADDVRVDVQRAIETLGDGCLHLSKYRLCEFVYVLHARKSGAWRLYPDKCHIMRTAFTTEGHVTYQFFPDGIQGWRSERNCFPTREEAEAEAARRNKEGAK